jgi:predicted AAA+ superfamily ATPase
MKLIKRFLTFDLPPQQSCFLWGARKTGKSTYLKNQFPNGIFIDLLHADVYQNYQREPHRLRQEVLANPTWRQIILDEVQKIPALLDEVHGLIESQRDLQFILCGSSSRRLRTTGANLLGGRGWRYLFMPLCYPELQTLSPSLDWKRILNNGLIPSHYQSNHAQKSLASYLFDYVLTEVQWEANVRKKDHFARFLDMLGFSQGEMVNYSNIARDCGMDGKTVKSYFEILEEMYLVYMLPPYRHRVKRQIIQEKPKFYWFDTGIANYLRRYSFSEMRGSEAGRSFEHYLFLELKAYQTLTEKRDSLFYWRTKDGHEVDFIFQDQAWEVKMSANIQAQHISNLVHLASEQVMNLNIISLETRKRRIQSGTQEITVWPVQEFLDQLWSGEIWK